MFSLYEFTAAMNIIMLAAPCALVCLILRYFVVYGANAQT